MSAAAWRVAVTEHVGAVAHTPVIIGLESMDELMGTLLPTLINNETKKWYDGMSEIVQHANLRTNGAFLCALLHLYSTQQYSLFPSSNSLFCYNLFQFRESINIKILRVCGYCFFYNDFWNLRQPLRESTRSCITLLFAESSFDLLRTLVRMENNLTQS